MSLHLRACRFILVAMAAAVQGCALHGADPAQLTKKADTALSQGDTARALTLLRSVRAEYAPVEYYIHSGALYRSLGTITGRVRSQRVLELGVRRYPDQPELWLELGKTHYAQTFYGDAARCFRRVLELDPANCDAHLYLGLDGFRRWKYIQVYTIYLAKAVPHFEHVARCDPGNRLASHRLALSSYALGDTARATSLSEMFMTNFPTAAEGYLLRGAIAYQQSDFVRCDSLFRTALSVAAKEERGALVDISLLLSDDPLETYAAASEDKRGNLERAFWAERDPDPTTPLNERYLEHVQRMFLADTFFDNATPRRRGWNTERGKAVIKFGWPDGVVTSLDGKPLDGPMEVWAYDNPFVGLTLFFRDEFLNGNYMVPMDYEYAHAAQALYLDPPVSHFVSPYWQIPGVMQVLTFHNGASSTDVYVALDVDLATMKDYVDLEACKRFFLRVNVFDDAWRPQAAYADTLDAVTLVEHASGESESITLVRKFNLDYDSLHVASCLEDDLSRTQTLLDGRTNTRRYLNSSVVMSDILLHRPTSKVAGDVIVRGDRAFVPHPSGKYDEAEKLGVYVEIYNLRRVESRSDYEIRYLIFAAREDRAGWRRVAQTLRGLMGFDENEEPVISHAFQRHGTEHTAEETLAIDIDALEAGDYILQISVTDRVSGDVATQYGTFSKVLGAATRPVAAH